MEVKQHCFGKNFVIVITEEATEITNNNLDTMLKLLNSLATIHKVEKCPNLINLIDIAFISVIIVIINNWLSVIFALRTLLFDYF